MTVTLETFGAPAPRCSEDGTPSFVAAIESQVEPNLPTTYDELRDLPTDQVAIALAASDLEVLPGDVLAAMRNEEELTAVETLPPHRPGLARKLVAWVAQGMERLGGAHGLWETDYANRAMENQGMQSWENNPIWGGYDRAVMMNQLSWSFHFWAGGEEPQIEHVTLWVVADPERPDHGVIGHLRNLNDLRHIEQIRPELRLEAWNGGYRWVSSA